MNTKLRLSVFSFRHVRFLVFWLTLFFFSFGSTSKRSKKKRRWEEKGFPMGFCVCLALCNWMMMSLAAADPVSVPIFFLFLFFVLTNQEWAHTHSHTDVNTPLTHTRNHQLYFFFKFLIRGIAREKNQNYSNDFRALFHLTPTHSTQINFEWIKRKKKN
jgi:hypothetical protein